MSTIIWYPKRGSEYPSFVWTPECQLAFDDIKAYLARPLILFKAQPQEPLSVYLVTSPKVVGVALVQEEVDIQKLVYYVRQVFRDVETTYSNLEKLAYALIVASRKLRHYFQGRLIKVMIDQPLKRILFKLDLSGRLVTWVVELSQYC